MRRSAARRKPRRQLARRELLRIDGKPVAVTVRLNPRARRMIVKVHPSTGEVSVVAPSRHGLDHALDFARSERDWIAKRLEHVPARVPLGLGAKIPFRGEMHVIRKGDKGRAPVWIERDGEERIIRVSGETEHVPRRVLDFLKREARKQLDARATHYSSLLEIKPRRITVRDTASRWGSCSTGRSLSFSWRLILAPGFVLDYVVAHEVAHLREMNHGARFWRLVGEMVADPDKPQRWLKQHGSALHRYAPRIGFQPSA
jgi:predicted metal-dependent hydrolase